MKIGGIVVAFLTVLVAIYAINYFAIGGGVAALGRPAAKPAGS